MRMVGANWDLPWAGELRSLLTKTVGVLGLLAEHLGELVGVDRAVVYGSWAARYTGRPGSFPRDVDVLVVGDPDRPAQRRVPGGRENAGGPGEPRRGRADGVGPTEAGLVPGRGEGGRAGGGSAAPVTRSRLAQVEAELVALGSLEKVRRKPAAVAGWVNDATRHVASAARLAEDDSRLAYAACHDAIRKALTGLLAHRGYRPAGGEGVHVRVQEWGSVALAGLVDETLPPWT